MILKIDSKKQDKLAGYSYVEQASFFMQEGNPVRKKWCTEEAPLGPCNYKLCTNPQTCVFTT